MPGRRGVDALVEARAPDPDQMEPDVSTFPSRLMRGTSPTTRMIVATARDAMVELEGPVGATVVGSAFGEISIAIRQLEMMLTGDGKVSPALFKNSVHNTAAGVLSVADANMAPSTAIAAGELSVAYALLEGVLQLEDGVPTVVVAVGDERLPEPLSQRGDWPHFAAAWVLSSAPPLRPCVALEPLTPIDAEPLTGPDVLAGHPCRSAWDVLDAVHHRRPGTLILGSEDGRGFGLRVHVHEHGGAR
ncbi:MAG: beta-ketoacyl synthase chain length factor [Nannocystaceae bacterium]|nr:beta-ketoacyl synthase chain length factor [Nannocystaceae bacterium]